MAYHNVPFPLREDYESNYGPGFRTRYTEKDSNDFERAGRHATALHVFNLAFRIRRLSHLKQIRDHFRLRGGGLHSFPFEDPLEHSTAADGLADPFHQDEVSVEMGGVANGTNRVFQCQTKVSDAASSYIRTITKPDATSRFYVNGTQDTDLALDVTTGEVIFTTPPPLGAIVTWAGEFMVEVIYAPGTDEELLQSYTGFNKGATESEVQLIEIVPKIPLRDDIPYGGSKDYGTIDTNISLSLGEARLHVWTDNTGVDAYLPDPNTIPSGIDHLRLFNEGTAETSVKLPDLTTTLVGIGQDQMARVNILERSSGTKEYLSLVPAV